MTKYNKDTLKYKIDDELSDYSHIKRARIAIALLILQGKTLKELKRDFYDFEKELS